LLLGLFALIVSERAAADDSSANVRQPSKAEALFALGKQRLAAGDYAAACSLLNDSFQADPATGSLLALALCHERQGKVASAIRDYEQVITRSRAEERPDREQAAQARVVALRERVSTITLQVSEPYPDDLTIRVNDTLLTKEDIGKPRLMDGGFVVVEVEAPGKASWSKHISLADTGEVLTLTLPPLGATAPSAPPPPVTPARGAQRDLRLRLQTKPARFNATEIVGIGLMAASAVGAAVAIGYTAVAVRKNHKSNDHCEDDICTSEGRTMRLDARKAGDIATIAVIATTAVAASGLITYLVGRHRPKDQPHDDTVRLSAGGFIVRTGGGAGISGSF
jgi:hypothetical protein